MQGKCIDAVSSPISCIPPPASSRENNLPPVCVLPHRHTVCARFLPRVASK